VVADVIDYALETSNSSLLFVAHAFQAEIALREGQLAKAGQWIDQLEAIPPLSAMIHLYEYQLTIVKFWLANNIPETRQKAADLLDQLERYTESYHNRLFQIEVLVLLAVLHAAENDQSAALARLEKAVELAQPGGIIWPFLDLGPPIAQLLLMLQNRGLEPDYLSRHVARILAAFDEAGIIQDPVSAQRSSEPEPILAEPLTTREMEVLDLLAQRLTNKEIAEKLVVSPDTIKTHTLSIYAKLDVHSRRQAVDKAREIGLLSIS
jgi:LuxR family maltose regulon positive regulatory protein